jgi:hypothetical protein
MALRTLGLGLLAVLLAAPALAGEDAPNQEQIFSAYIASPGYGDYLETIFNKGEPATMMAECAHLKVIEFNKLIVLTPPVFKTIEGRYTVESGEWVAQALLDRCGAKVTRRALLTVRPTTSGTTVIDPIMLLPGEFPGNLQLEADARRIVIPGLLGTAQCEDFDSVRVLDVKALTPAAAEGWSETWVAQACGKRVEAEVTYTADATGMNISARNWKVQ